MDGSLTLFFFIFYLFIFLCVDGALALLAFAFYLSYYSFFTLAMGQREWIGVGGSGGRRVRRNFFFFRDEKVGNFRADEFVGTLF